MDGNDKGNGQVIGEDVMQTMSVAPPEADIEAQEPEARAFTGHPDHPPRDPDDGAEQNQEVLDQAPAASKGGNGASGADRR